MLLLITAGAFCIAQRVTVEDYFFGKTELGPLFWQKERIVVPANEAGATIVAKRKNSGSSQQSWDHYCGSKKE